MVQVEGYRSGFPAGGFGAQALNTARAESWSADLKELVEARLGHRIARARVGPMCEAVCALATQRGFSDMAEYMEMLSELSLDAPLVQSLIHTLTRRDGGFFESSFGDASLLTTVLPELKESCSGRHLIRAWTPQCGAGERSYSLAVLLSDLTPDAWNVSVLGTDIDIRQLRRARRARYGQWTVSGLPGRTVQSCFRLDRTEASVTVRSEIRKLAAFAFHDVSDPKSAIPFPGSFDLIDARGVMRRLTPKAQRAALATFRQALGASGMLLLDPMDPDPEGNWRRTILPDLVVWRPLPGEHAAVEDRSCIWLNEESQHESAPMRCAAQMVIDALRLARGGTLPSALALAREAILAAPDWADAYVVLSDLLVAHGQEPSGIQELQRALHLDTSMADAHLRLGRLLAKHGANAAAVRSFRSAIALVGALELPSPEDEDIRRQACQEVIEHL